MKIPNYDVKEVIGEGGMAVVYRAMHQLLKQERAIKIMFSSFANEPAFEKNFLQEGQIVASLNHPNIVKIHDVGRCDEGYFMAMEYLTGGTLGDKLKRYPLVLDEAITIIQQIGGALHYAHQRGLIHRDIKPNNIMFRANGDAVLTDFGISKLQNTEGNLTQCGYGKLGTPRYMSPEQTTDETLTQRSDMYSLALVFYEMLMGKPGINSKTTVSIIREHVLSPPPSFPPVYAYFQPVLDKALAKEPQDRYATIQEFVSAILSQKPDTDDQTVIISNLDESAKKKTTISEVKLEQNSNNSTEAKINYKPMLYLLLLFLSVGGIGWLFTQSSLLSDQDNKINTLLNNEVRDLQPTTPPQISSPLKKDQIVETEPPLPNPIVSEEKHIKEEVNTGKNISPSPPSCNVGSDKIEEGINCFNNKNLNQAKNIFNNVIKTIGYKDYDHYLKSTLYLALISIESKDNISATKNIKHLYFLDPEFKLSSYSIDNKNYNKIFEQTKHKAREAGDKEFDHISHSSFIWVSTCNPPCANGFWIGEKEISQQQWYRIIPTEEDINDKEQPIRDITWEQANKFSKTVRKRLCSTHEWTEALKTVNTESYKDAIIGQSGWSPSSVNTGEKGKTGIINLVGNIMEFTTNKNKPSYIGLYWSQMPDGLMMDDIKKSSKKATVKTKSFNIGLRLCH